MRRLLALAVLALSALAAHAGDEPALPPGVVARVYGRDIREDDVLERLVKRWGATERGRAVLDQLIDDTCVEVEARRRGVTVTDEEVAAYVRKVDESIRKETGNARSVDDIYREQHSSAAEFALVAREYLKRQKLAMGDMGGKAGEEIPEARLKLWLATIRRRLAVKTTGLPAGALAVIGEGTTIDRAAYARALHEQLGLADTTAARAELVMEAASEHALAEAKVTVTDEDVEAEVARVRARFADDPRVKGTGLTFDQFLRQSRGTSEEEWKKDPAFRTSIALDRMLSRDISDAAIRDKWEKNRDAYGERALVRQIYVAAGDKGSQFHMRSAKEAFEVALRARVAVLDAAGGLPGTDASVAKKPLRDAVTAVAKQFEDDKERRAAAGEPTVWTRLATAGEEKLTKAVFEDEAGTLIGPIASRIGYHVLLVEERRPAPPFDEVKDRVREDLVRDALLRFQIALRTDPNVVIAK